MKKAFIITARTPSTRLPSKIIKKIYKNKRTIDLLIERAKKVDLPIILATTKNSEDDFLCNYVKKKHNIKVFRRNFSKAKRWYDCFTKFNIELGCIIEGDDPLFNFDFYKKEINKKINYDVLTYSKNMITGVFFHIFTYNGISKMYKYALNNGYKDTEIIDPFIKKAKLKKKTIRVNKIFRNKKIRLTLDYPEDYKFMKIITKKMGYLSETAEIIKFLIKNKKISKINYFRENDFSINQSKIIKGWNIR